MRLRANLNEVIPTAINDNDIAAITLAIELPNVFMKLKERCEGITVASVIGCSRNAFDRLGAGCCPWQGVAALISNEPPAMSSRSGVLDAGLIDNLNSA